MASARVRLSAVLLLAAPFLPPPTSASREGPAPFLDPKRYTSPSSRFVLEVDPTDPQGAGPARYRLFRDGSEAWSRDLPFTFWSAVVTDDGSSAGYAYPEGIRGGDRNDFTVAMLGPDGEVRSRRACRREGVPEMCPMPDAVNGLFLDAHGGRAVVRVETGAVSPREAWWSFRLSDGEELGKSDPRRFLPALEDFASLRAAAAVPSTNLTLVHFWTASRGSASFALLAPDSKPVWTLDLLGDYSRKSSDSLRTWEWIQQGNAIAAGTESGRFEIRSVREQKRIRFEATPDSNAQTGWTIREVGREPFAIDLEEPPQPSFPTVELEKLGTVRFEKGAGAASSPIRDVLAFDFDSQGRLEVIRQKTKDEAGPTSCLVETDGSLVRETRFPPVGTDPEARRHWLRISDERWLATASGFGVGATASAWWADSRTGELKAIEGFESPPVEELARDGRGGFLVLANRLEEYASTPVLLAFDSEGRRRWTLEGMGNVVTNDPAKLFSPASVAATGDGTVVVTDSIRKTIQLFDAAGRFTREISLAKSWGEARYPGHVTASGGNEIVVHDSGGSTDTLWRMRLDGTVVSSLQPRHADGHSPPPWGGSLRVAPDGRLWTTDRQMLQRLGADGTVDRVVGNVPDSAAPQDFDDPIVDSLGRVLALDGRARVVQIFDREGRRLAIGRLEAQETPTSSPFADPGNGDVLVRVQNREYVRFDDRGKRLGRSRFADEGTPHRCIFRPGTKECWLVTGFLGDSLVRATDHAGSDRESRSIRRRPDGRWLRGIESVSISTDGTLFFLDGSSRSSPIAPAALCIVPASGGDGRTVELPGHALGDDLAVLRDWYAFGSMNSVHLMNRASGEISRVELDLPEGEKPWIETFASPDGKELWVIERKTRTLTRYAAP